MKFYSQLNTSGREPSPCDTPVSHSIDIPTEELKIVRSLERLLPPTLRTEEFMYRFPLSRDVQKYLIMGNAHINRTASIVP